MESTRAEREINNVGDCGDEYKRTFFEKPSVYQDRIRLFVGTVEQDLIDFRFRCRPEGRKKTEGEGGEGVCGDTAGEMLVREIQSLEILSVKKEAKLSYWPINAKFGTEMKDHTPI